MRVISVRLPTRLLIALIYLVLVRIQNLLMIIAHRRQLLPCYLSLIFNLCANAHFSLRCSPSRLRKFSMRTCAYLYCAYCSVNLLRILNLSVLAQYISIAAQFGSLSCFCAFLISLILAHFKSLLFWHIMDLSYFCAFQTYLIFAHYGPLLFLHIVDLSYFCALWT